MGHVRQKAGFRGGSGFCFDFGFRQFHLLLLQAGVLAVDKRVTALQFPRVSILLKNAPALDEHVGAQRDERHDVNGNQSGHKRIIFDNARQRERLVTVANPFLVEFLDKALGLQLSEFGVDVVAERFGFRRQGHASVDMADGETRLYVADMQLFQEDVPDLYRADEVIVSFAVVFLPGFHNSKYRAVIGNVGEFAQAQEGEDLHCGDILSVELAQFGHAVFRLAVDDVLFPRRGNRRYQALVILDKLRLHVERDFRLTVQERVAGLAP